MSNISIELLKKLKEKTMNDLLLKNVSTEAVDRWLSYAREIRKIKELESIESENERSNKNKIDF